MSGCLGETAAALVDGELDHPGRERAHRHLAHCASCRVEVDAQRRVKARLLGLDEPALSGALASRLLALSTPPATAAQPPARPAPAPVRVATGRPDAARSVSVRPASTRPAPRRSAAVGPAGRSARARELRRRAVAGSALAVVGVAAAFALGSPPARPASTPVDPGADMFVAEFVDVSNPGTRSDRADLPVGYGSVGSELLPTRASLVAGGGGSRR